MRMGSLLQARSFAARRSKALLSWPRIGCRPRPDGRYRFETQVSTSEDGTYEFAHLPVGARTFFYSAPGRDLAPAIKDLIVVQDGLGAQLDVTLKRPTALRIQLGWS